MKNAYTRLKFACYTVNISMAAVTVLSSLLFLTFRSLYGISYSLLGLLVLINFLTQLSVDLFLSFFSHRVNIPFAVKMTPVLTCLGLFIYGAWPFLFPNAVYAGLVIGTVIFSAAAGLNEVLTSPVIAAIPSKDPDREMSKLHSTYAWGVVGVIVLTTVFLRLLGEGRWQWLALLFMLIPTASMILFAGVKIPDMATPERASGAVRLLKNRGLWLSVAGIFLGSVAEAVMTQWSSGYLEAVLGIPKLWGDILGVAMFAVMLGLGRTLYAKFGKNIERVLILGAVGAVFCYLIAALTPIPALGLAACALTGFCTSMLWPGSLVAASDRFPTGGVFIFAMMASGGDFGAAVGPQLVGVITDVAVANPTLSAWASSLSLTPDQLGMKLGMLVAMLFPLAAIPIYVRLWKSRKKQ
ncbi:MAG: MFS transporter [Clostridia bacterium]|nr:MFS transporter [Clostridia bacterium]